MSRRIEIADDALRIHYRGPISWILFLRTLEVPYGAMESVGVGLEALPGYSLRVGDRIRGKGTVRGRFYRGGRWYFLDLHHRERTIVITTIPNSRFALVAFEPSADVDPESIAEEIRARL